MTVEQLITRFLASKTDRSGSTQSDYRLTLAYAKPIYRVPIRMVGPMELDELIDSIPQPASRHRPRGKLSMLFRQAIKWNLIRSNPVDATKRQTYKPDKAETFSPEEVTNIIDTGTDYRLIGLFDLGFTLGPRPEELFGFQWQDWDESGQQLKVRRKVAEINGTLEIGP